MTLSEGQKEAFVWDTELPGFGVRLRGQRLGLRGAVPCQWSVSPRYPRHDRAPGAVAGP